MKSRPPSEPRWIQNWRIRQRKRMLILADLQEERQELIRQRDALDTRIRSVFKRYTPNGGEE